MESNRRRYGNSGVNMNHLATPPNRAKIKTKDIDLRFPNLLASFVITGIAANPTMANPVPLRAFNAIPAAKSPPLT